MSRHSQDQETFLAPSADNQTHNCDPECSNHHHHHFLPIQTKVKEIDP